jgi:Protein of unknown function (DUF2794)
LSVIEPITFQPRPATSGSGGRSTTSSTGVVSIGNASVNAAFNRQELNAILSVYGQKVASGEWRDYAIDFTPDKAVFSIFRRTSECPLFRVEKCPGLARKQGAYAVVAMSGHILKRGHELDRVLAVLV